MERKGTRSNSASAVCDVFLQDGTAGQQQQFDCHQLTALELHGQFCDAAVAAAAGALPALQSLSLAGTLEAADLAELPLSLTSFGYEHWPGAHGKRLLPLLYSSSDPPPVPTDSLTGAVSVVRGNLPSCRPARDA